MFPFVYMKCFLKKLFLIRRIIISIIRTHFKAGVPVV